MLAEIGRLGEPGGHLLVKCCPLAFAVVLFYFISS